MTSTALVVLTGIDVIHALALPTLAVKADAIPGRIAVVSIEFVMSGLYAGQCSELCGALHGFMPISVLALSLLFIKNSRTLVDFETVS